MQSQRILQRIERLLADADAAIDDSDWARVRDRAQNVLRLDPENTDALTYLAAADRGEAAPNRSVRTDAADPARGQDLEAPPSHPESFCDGRYQVLGFLGEGGKKRVYLAHDTKLDRDVVGEPEQARVYYRQALDVCEKIRFRPEIALTRLALAELLMEHYPEERAKAWSTSISLSRNSTR